MANTTNFNWETPDDTDLVKDGAAAIRTLGSAIDTSLVDLKGGTTDQILAKNSNTNMDFKWVAPTAGDIEGVTAGVGISGGGTSGTVTITNSMATAIDAKGDLIAGTGADTFARLAVGTNGHTLVADSAETTGLKWAAPSTGALTLVKRSSFSDVANTGTTFDDVFTSTYKSYRIVIENIFAVTEANDLYFQFRYAGPTTEAGNTYFGNQLAMISTSTTTTNNANNGTPQFILSTRIGQTNFRSSGIFDVTRVGDGNRIPNLSGTFVNGSNNETFITLGLNIEQRTFTGFILKSSSTNIDGTVAVYGLA